MFLWLAGWVLQIQAQQIPEFFFWKSDAPAETKVQKPYLLKPDAEEKKRILKKLLEEKFPVGLYCALSNSWQEPLTTGIKATLKTRIRQEEKDTSMHEILYLLLDDTTNKLPDSESNTIQLLDFNADHFPDLILFPGVYFGPSSGYQYWGKGFQKWEKIWENAGVSVWMKTEGKELVIRHQVIRIEDEEPMFVQELSWNWEKKTGKQTFKYFYPSQFIATKAKPGQEMISPVIPTSPGKQKPEGYFKTNQTAPLRATPAILNQPAPELQEQTKVWKGNILAQVTENQTCLVLGSQGNWKLAAFIPQTKFTEKEPYRNHGMDWDTESKGWVAPWYVGWIEARFLYAVKP